ncbi:hypothetical protein K501DRAFT_337871 [Backusella circina FSU 941]|nr:hypothetical protein K501DRAFT_337871 [Backusella circina FSU 941]
MPNNNNNIEFFLHPPSPKLNCTLPSVSTLLQHSSPASPSSPKEDTLPSLCLPDTPLTNDLEPVEPSPTLNSSCPNSPWSSPSLSPFMGSLTLDSPPQTSSPFYLLPPPNQRCRSLSNASTSSSLSSISTQLSNTLMMNRRLSDPPLYSPAMDHASSFRRTSSASPPPAPPSTSPSVIPPTIKAQSDSTPAVHSLDGSKQSHSLLFVAKQKRGRPPNASRQASSQRDSWTFVTPTVWDVKHREEPTLTDQEYDQDSFMVLHWPPGHGPKQTMNNANDESSTGLSTFTNTNMDTTLSIPKKKRGRKPKMQLEGNFCFVWRDLTARRGANKKTQKKTLKSKNGL